MKTPDWLKKMALERAQHILETWWHEGRWEFQEEWGITKEQMSQILKIKFTIAIDE